MLFLVIFACAGGSIASNIETYSEFKYIDYDWKSDDHKARAIADGYYNYQLIWPDDFQPVADGRVFVTTPRPLVLTPSSLSVVSNKTGEGGPLLSPYPSWDWTSVHNCSSIINAIRIVIDDCDRLWVVDTGKSKALQLCPAKIMAFDLSTDELVFNVEIPQNLLTPVVGLATIQAVRTTDSCTKVQVFVADLLGFGLLIWDGTEIWRIDDDIFWPSLTETVYTVADETFVLPFGVAGSVLTPRGYLDDQYLLLRSMSSVKYWAVSVTDLLNSKSGRAVKWYKSTKESATQHLARDMSSTGVLISGYGTDTKFACANLLGDSPFANTILNDDKEIWQFVASAKFVEGREDGRVRMRAMTNRFQKFYRRTMDFTEINIRILGTNDFGSLIENTPCETVAPKNLTITDVMSFELYKTKTY